MKKTIQTLLKTLPILMILGGFSITGNAGFLTGTDDNIFLATDTGTREMRNKFKENTFKKLHKKSNISNELNKYYQTLTGNKIDLFTETKNTFVDVENVALERVNWPTSLAKLISEQHKEYRTNDKSFYKIALVIKKFYRDKTIQSEETADNAYDIQSIGLFANGTLEDSSFDLIVDMEEINEIILGKGDIYEGNRKAKGISPKLRDFIDSVDENPFKAKTNSEIKELKAEILPPKVKEKLKENEESAEISHSSGVCMVDNSGLSDESLRVANGQEEQKDFRDLEEDLSAITRVIKEDLDEKVDESKKILPDLDYTPKKDSWGCEEGQIICIKIDFSSYNLAPFGDSTNSIDYVITRSNEHLRKGAFTSKIQAKMAQNNFELNLKDLDLTNIFSGGVIIEYKPIPLLNNVSGGKTQTIGGNNLESEQIMKKSFDAIGLNFKRENDLTKFFGTTDNQMSTVQAKGGKIVEVAEAQSFLNEMKERNSKKLNIINTNVNEAVKSAGNNEDLTLQLVELKTFIGRLGKYTTTLRGISEGLKKIPQSNQ